MSKRRTQSPEFKDRVAMEAINSRKKIKEIVADRLHSPHSGEPVEAAAAGWRKRAVHPRQAEQGQGNWSAVLSLRMICFAVCLVCFMVRSPVHSGRMRSHIHTGATSGVHARGNSSLWDHYPYSRWRFIVAIQSDSGW